MRQTEDVQRAVQAVAVAVTPVEYGQRGYHLLVELENGRVRDFARIMHDQGYFIGFVTAVHVAPAIEVRYQFAHFDRQSRVMGFTTVDAAGAVPTIADIFPGANWHERETRDFYGVVFTGHPNLEPLILPEEDVDLKPLLKSEKNLKDAAAVRWPEPKVAEDTAAAPAAKE
ncbi:MAG: NADH-quinone oxidoreductase subunit C [Deltaproteobacteria bacterium]|nr:NADH-quinone oxidoreductase subunit C [Candidatus Anaeroferrophillacea bacterium]